ncbi:MAG: MBL fold metallo-hydrolase [Planctomycetota bacterium]
MNMIPSKQSCIAALICLLLSLFSQLAAPVEACNREPSASPSQRGFWQPDSRALPELFAWTDTCNVYLIRQGNEALLVNLGNGSVLEHLPELGIDRVAWLLLTDHHREQYQGIAKIDRNETRVAAPQAEKTLFENPTQFRKWNAKLSDQYSVHGASYVRPSRIPVPLDRVLKPSEEFVWKGIDFECMNTPGHSPAGMSYKVRVSGKQVALIGGLMHDGAKMSNWFDTEWDYGFAKGLDVLMDSVDSLRNQEFDLILCSHGPAIFNPKEQFNSYYQKLVHFRKRYVRGYPVFDSKPREWDALSVPTVVPNVNRVSPHIYKLSREHPGKNFAMIVSDSGKGLVLDCGLFSEKMLDQIIAGMRQHLGLKEIDALWVSHMHGDHFLLGPVLQRKYGAKTWTLDRIANKCEQPLHYDYAALVSAYSDGIPGMRIDRRFRDGESIDWEGYKIQVDWMPGQTEFGCCLWLEIDGMRVAFTGDNLFGNPRDPTQDGHECVVARNSGIFEEGYLHAAEYLNELKPDLLMGGHSWVMDEPDEFIERYHAWAIEIIELYQDLLPEKDYEYLFDPYWVSAYPYRLEMSESESREVTITVRNFRDTPQRHRIELKLPPGVSAEPKILEGEIAAHSRASFSVQLLADESFPKDGVHIVTTDITLSGDGYEKQYGELFDFLIRSPGSETNAEFAR